MSRLAIAAIVICTAGAAAAEPPFTPWPRWAPEVGFGAHVSQIGARSGATRSAAVQLSVPVITALAALALFGEPLRPTLIAGGAAIILGLALALSSRPR